MNKRRKESSRYPALKMVDDAFGLVRERWLSFGALYVVGAIPFYGFLIYFVEDASFGSGDVGRMALQSLLLATLYFWMKTWHCFACQDLRDAMRRESRSFGGAGEVVRVALLQMRLQGYALWGFLLSSVLVAPFGWAFAYSQFLCAAGCEDETAKGRRERSWKAAKSLAQPIHLFLAIHAVVWIVAWVNAATLVYFVPELMRMFFGIDTVMAQRGWNLFNTTFLVISFCAAAIATDGLAKAFFTQLLYKSESVRSGHDILSKFSRIPGAGNVALIAIALFLVCPTWAQESATDEGFLEVVSENEIQEMRNSIERALSDSEISWRMKRPSAEATDDGGAVAAALEKLVEVGKYTAEKIGDFIDWLMGRDETRTIPHTRKASGGGADGFLRLLAFLGIAIVVGLVLWILVTMATRKPVAPKDAGKEDTKEVELSDETVHASLLPSERWMSLAREKAESGDYRLAIRAVFLATLALLGSKRLLALAQHKSNLEYAQELEKRGMPVEGRFEFNAFRRGFDRIWYGNYSAAESMYLSAVEHFKRLDEMSG